MNSRGTWQTLLRKLRWDRLYRATSYLKSALWTVPLFAIAIVGGLSVLAVGLYLAFRRGRRENGAA